MPKIKNETHSLLQQEIQSFSSTLKESTHFLPEVSKKMIINSIERIRSQNGVQIIGVAIKCLKECEKKWGETHGIKETVQKIREHIKSIQGYLKILKKEKLKKENLDLAVYNNLLTDLKGVFSPEEESEHGDVICIGKRNRPTLSQRDISQELINLNKVPLNVFLQSLEGCVKKVTEEINHVLLAQLFQNLRIYCVDKDLIGSDFMEHILNILHSDDLFEKAITTLGSVDQKEVSSIFNNYCKLNLKHNHFEEALINRLKELLKSMDIQSIFLILNGCVKLEIQDKNFIDQLVEQGKEVVSSMNAQNIGLVLNACVQLKIQDEEFINQLIEQAKEVVFDMNARSIGLVLNACMIYGLDIKHPFVIQCLDCVSLNVHLFEKNMLGLFYALQYYDQLHIFPSIVENIKEINTEFVSGEFETRVLTVLSGILKETGHTFTLESNVQNEKTAYYECDLLLRLAGRVINIEVDGSHHFSKKDAVRDFVIQRENKRGKVEITDIIRLSYLEKDINKFLTYQLKVLFSKEKV